MLTSVLCLQQVNIPCDEIASIIEDFREDHMAELQQLSEQFGFSLGYGYKTSAKREGESNKSNSSLDEADDIQVVPVPEAA